MAARVLLNGVELLLPCVLSCGGNIAADMGVFGLSSVTSMVNDNGRWHVSYEAPVMSSWFSIGLCLGAFSSRASPMLGKVLGSTRGRSLQSSCCAPVSFHCRSSSLNNSSNVWTYVMGCWCCDCMLAEVLALVASSPAGDGPR